MNAVRHIHKPRCRRGASTLEYVLLLAFFVIPIALLTPTILGIITTYGSRVVWALRLPFG